MAEQVALAAPVSVVTSVWTLRNVILSLVNATITVELGSDSGGLLIKTYDSSTTPTGATLLHTLNTANFSTNSLVKQVYARLQADGVLGAGSITGSPQ